MSVILIGYPFRRDHDCTLLANVRILYRKNDDMENVGYDIYFFSSLS